MKYPPGTAPTSDRPRPHRSSVSNGNRLFAVEGVDQRTQTALRFKDLVAIMTADLGGADLLSELQRQMIRRAATLSVMSEAIEADVVRDIPCDLNIYGMLSDRLRRVAETLGVRRVPRPVDGPQTIDDIAASPRWPKPASRGTMSSKRVNIGMSAAMCSPLLFEPYFRGDSWATWRSVIRAAYAEPMSVQDVERFRAVADRDPPKSRISEFICAVGRGGGKDSIASLIATVTAINFDPKGKLRPGERATVMCLACDRSQAGIVHSYIRAYFEAIPALRALVTHIGAESIELKNHVTIAVHTNSFRAIRGRTLLCVIFDEAAFFRDELSASPDVELDRAVGPGLARMPGSMKIIISSVHKRSGLLYEKVREFHGKNDPEALVVVGTTMQLNPSFDERVINRALEQDFERYGAEYLCKWRFIALDLLDGAVDHGVAARPPIGRTNYVAGCDASGGRGDSFTAAIVHKEQDGAVILDAMFERITPFDPSVVVAEIAALMREYRVSEITGDHYTANWVIEAFSKAGIKYLQCERDRSAVYMDTLPLFTSGRVRLLDDRKLIAQFANLEIRILATGREKVEPGPGHDDLANSCAIALTLAGSDSAPAFIKYADFLNSGQPVEEPNAHYFAYVSMACDADGKAAVIGWKVNEHLNPALVLCDFRTGYFSDPIFADYSSSLSLCYYQCSSGAKTCALVPTIYIPSESDVIKTFEFAPRVVALVAAGKVRLSKDAHERSRTAPIGSALDFRIEKLSDPLAAASLAGICLGLLGNPSDLR